MKLVVFTKGLVRPNYAAECEGIPSLGGGVSIGRIKKDVTAPPPSEKFAIQS